MKKGYYVLFKPRQRTVNITRKIEMQLKAFNKQVCTEVIEIESVSNVRNIINRLPWLDFALYKFEQIYQKVDNPDFIYFRRINLNRPTVDFFVEFKKRYPNCKIIVEIFTYPYIKDEYNSLKNYFIGKKEKQNTKYYCKFVDRFVTYTNDKEIYGVKTISTINGVDVERYRTAKMRSDDGEIHMVGVAMFQKHHGYERVISGLYNYYKMGGQRIVKVYFVGDGEEKCKYQELVKKYNLEKNIYFCGVKEGKELDDIYNQVDIGLGSFGFYKIGLATASSLKTREYLSKGLVVVAGCPSDVKFDEKKLYYLEVSNDDTDLKIDEIISFYERELQKCGNDRQLLAEQIHKFAEKTVSMDTTMKPIIDYIKK